MNMTDEGAMSPAPGFRLFIDWSKAKARVLDAIDDHPSLVLPCKYW